MEASLKEYFESHPLSEKERNRGRFLRIAGCLRSNEGKFEDGPNSYIWIVLSGFLNQSETKVPHCCAVSSMGGRIRDIRGLHFYSPSLMFSHSIAVVQSVARPWMVQEFAFTIPVKSERLAFFDSSHLILLSRTSVMEYRDAYGAMISNASVDKDYPLWLEMQREHFSQRPVPVNTHLMSIVTPAFKTPPEFLRKMIDSVLAQTYKDWELIIVNASPEDKPMREVLDSYQDLRVKVIDCPENKGIAGNTNVGIKACSGDYISFFDHDDIVEPFALAEIVRAIQDGDVPDLLYCDEDNIDEDDRPSLPLIKPARNLDFLLSNNYVIHWLTIRHDLLDEIELSDDDVNGAQDYDLTLKVFERSFNIVRVPAVLYHWRIHSGSTAGDPASKSYAQDAGSRAIKAYCRRNSVDASVRRGRAYFTYEVKYSFPQFPSSILVIGMGGVSGCARGSLKEYEQKYSVEVNLQELDFQSTAQDLLSCVRSRNRFDTVLLMRGTLEIELPDLELLISTINQRGVFAVSPKVLRSDGLIDFAGALLCPDGRVGRLLRLLPEADGGYVGRSQRPYCSVALNADCILFNMSLLQEIGFEPSVLSVDSACAEACYRAFKKGLRNVFLPYSSARIGSARSFFTDANGGRCCDDETRFSALHPELAQGDPSHSPNFDQQNLYYRLNWSRWG